MLAARHGSAVWPRPRRVTRAPPGDGERNPKGPSCYLRGAPLGPVWERVSTPVALDGPIRLCAPTKASMATSQAYSFGAGRTWSNVQGTHAQQGGNRD